MSPHLLLLAIAVAGLSPLAAQVPQVIHYQGKIQTGTMNFSGTGGFKFSLVNSPGSSTYWSNDGSGAAGTEPAGQVALTVTNGLYAVGLGDISVPGMTAMPYSVFGNTGVNLRIWFNDGVHGFQQLSPDQPVAAVGYAMMAANIRDGAVGSAQIANGSVTPEKLAPGLPILPGGALIPSPDYLDPALLAAGYQVFGGPNFHGDAWTQYGSVGQPSARTTPPNGAIWTGTEMIFWGDFTNPGGGRFNPQTKAWTTLTNAATHSPGPRSNYTTTWTGTEMIVWGGSNSSVNASTYGSVRYRTGARYKPQTGEWSTMSDPADFVPGFEAREHHTAVWTGTEMVVWGGVTTPLSGGSSAEVGNGAIYNPADDTWRPMSNVSSPAARSTHTAVWTGSHMIVWGGSASYLNDGAIYNPAADTWAPMANTTSIGLAGRTYPESVWTGAEMIVWGGYRPSHTHMSDGARYNPGTNVWTILPSAGLSGRYAPKLVWTGKEMLVYAGSNVDSGPFADGAAYDPATNSWSPMTLTGAPSARRHFPAVWNGRELLVCNSQSPGDIYGYAPRRTYYLYQKP